MYDKTTCKCQWFDVCYGQTVNRQESGATTEATWIWKMHLSQKLFVIAEYFRYFLWRSFALYFSFTMSYLTASIQQTARFRLKIDKRLISTKQLLWQWRISWEFQLKSSDEVFKFAYNDDFLFDIRNILIVARLRTINHLLVTICQSRHFSSRTIFFSKMVTRHMAFLYTLKMRTRCINHNKLVSCQFSSFQWSCVPLSQQMNRGKAVEYFQWKRRKSMWNFFSHQLGWCSRT